MVSLQVSVVVSVVVDGAFDSFLRGSLGSRSVRAERNSEVGDVSSADVVDETCRKGRKKAKKCELILSRYDRSAQGEDERDPRKKKVNSPWT